MPAKMNPFEVKTKPADRYYMDWQKLYPRPYDKNEVDPYTRLRIILMNGTEYEANWFSHQFHRHCTNNDLRRELAVLRRTEQQQQKRIACLKPINESILETTIGYEQLAVDLTAILAQREPDAYVVQVMNLALLEDFDHLYRYADLLELERGIHAERLVGCYTEIMPGRPTIAEHRHPRDSVRKPISAATAAPITKLNAAIITAAEQQTMNYYMNIGTFYDSDLGRRLYQEIGMIEDDPDWKVFMNLMAALYQHHPIRVSVAGSVESISHITADTLYACHKAFYTPSNMVLTVAGDVEPEEVVRIAREILPKEPGGHIERDYGGEEDGAAAKPEKEPRHEL